MPSAQASTHIYRERPGQVTYRSQQSLRDRTDRAWQAIVFKRVQPQQPVQLSLRLVGFPGAVSVLPEQPLQITTNLSQVWRAPYQHELDFPDNVGQYDISVFAEQLAHNSPLELSVPLADRTTAEIVVPPFVIQEWREIASSDALPSGG